MADSIRFERMRPFLDDSLANCCLNLSANYPLIIDWYDFIDFSIALISVFLLPFLHM